MKISIIGSGYVGLVTGACLAEIGNQVICADNDKDKIKSLQKCLMPIYEPGLKELIKRNLRNKHLRFSSNIEESVRFAEIIFITVGTPSLDNGEADLTGIEKVARNIAKNLKEYKLIVEKSTVPVETGKWVKHTISTYVKNEVEFDVASNPEFLREGQAIDDFMNPDRIVLGVESERARELLVKLYKPFKAPLVVTNIKSAELIKHASNAFLATKISFINAVARVCDKVGADVEEVAQGMGLDKRIGLSFLKPGLGYGGSCFPKDLDAFVHISEKVGYDFDLLKSVRKVNSEQMNFMLKKIKDSLWIIKDKTIAVLGLAFKSDTDDIRNSPAIGLTRALQQEGAKIKVYDPQAIKKAKRELKKIIFCEDVYSAVRGADCLLIATEWDEFRKLDLVRIKKLLKRPLIIDGRNLLDPKVLEKSGFHYVSVGRRSV